MFMIYIWRGTGAVMCLRRFFHTLTSESSSVIPPESCETSPCAFRCSALGRTACWCDAGVEVNFWTAWPAFRSAPLSLPMLNLSIYLEPFLDCPFCSTYRIFSCVSTALFQSLWLCSVFLSLPPSLPSSFLPPASLKHELHTEA